MNILLGQNEDYLNYIKNEQESVTGGNHNKQTESDTNNLS